MSYQICKAKLKNELTPSQSVSSYFSLSQCQFFSFLVGVSSVLVQLYIYSYPNLYKPNLSKGEQKAMEELAKREDIMITNAEKGGAVVIMDIEKQISEANRQLPDKRNYKKLEEDSTLQYSSLVNDTIDRFEKESQLSKKLADGLKSANPKTPKFYISPKIYKENNPGRPVINSITRHTSEISRFVDHHLQPLVREIPSYIKNTNDFINKIDNFAVPPNSFLVIMDVVIMKYSQ